VSEAARDLAMAPFRLIQPYLEERRSPPVGRSRCQPLISDRPEVGTAGLVFIGMPGIGKRIARFPSSTHGSGSSTSSAPSTLLKCRSCLKSDGRPPALPSPTSHSSRKASRV
jgi:hypothetical protein